MNILTLSNVLLSTTITLSIGELVTIMVFIGGLLTVWMDSRLRVNSLEIRMKSVRESLFQHSTDNIEAFKKIEQQISTMLKDNKIEFEKLREEIIDILTHQNKSK